MAVGASAENKFRPLRSGTLTPRVDVGARGDGVGPSSPGPDGASGATADSAASTPPLPQRHRRDLHDTTAQGPK